MKRRLLLLAAVAVLLAACAPRGKPPALAAVSPEEAGLAWRECAVSRFELAQAEACLGTRRPARSEAERARLGTRSASGLRLAIGGSTYQTRHLGLGVIPAWPWDPYVLLKDGRPVAVLFGEIDTYDADLSLQEMAGQVAWEFADARQTTVIYGGRDLRRVYGLEAAYAPYELGGKLALVAKRDGRYCLVYDGRQVGPTFDDVAIAHCCEAMLYSAGGGEGRYRFWGRRDGRQVVVEVAPAAPALHLNRGQAIEAALETARSPQVEIGPAQVPPRVIRAELTTYAEVQRQEMHTDDELLQGTGAAERPVWLVIMEGRWQSGFPMPTGVPTPEPYPRYMVVLDAATGERVMVAVRR